MRAANGCPLRPILLLLLCGIDDLLLLLQVEGTQAQDCQHTTAAAV